MIIEELVARFHGAKKTAHGEWVTRCPSHEDRSPSLSIAEGRDGRILVLCRAGCSLTEVLDAVGLTIPDVMPDRVSDYHEVLPRLPFSPRTMLYAVENDAMILASMACRIAYSEEPMTLEDKDKFVALAGSIRETVSYATK